MKTTVRYDYSPVTCKISSKIWTGTKPVDICPLLLRLRAYIERIALLILYSIAPSSSNMKKNFMPVR